MNLSMFESVKCEPLEVPSSNLLIGKSGVGKSTLTRQLLSSVSFCSRFNALPSQCSKVLLVFSTWQSDYQSLLNNFSCPSVLSSSLKPEYAEAGFWPRNSSSQFSIAIIDDQLASISSSNKSDALQTLEKMITITSHHSNLLIFVLVQSTSGSNKYRSLLRQFSNYFIFAGSDNMTLRYLSSFLLPYQTRVLTNIIQSFGFERGRYLLVRNSFESSQYRLLWLNLIRPSSEVIDTVYVVNE